MFQVDRDIRLVGGGKYVWTTATNGGEASARAVSDARETLHTLRLQALWAEERAPTPTWRTDTSSWDACRACGLVAWEYRTLPSGRHQSRCTSCGDVVMHLSADVLYRRYPEAYPVV